VRILRKYIHHNTWLKKWCLENIKNKEKICRKQMKKNYVSQQQLLSLLYSIHLRNITFNNHNDIQ